VFRLSTRADPAFLAEMCYEIAYWRDDGAEQRPPLDALIADPQHARFVEGWGRPGDLAVLALDRRDEPVGAAWCRRFDTCEMRIAVYPEFRRSGVGSLLLGSLEARARAAGEPCVVTHAAPDNPAHGVLVKRGFRPDPEQPARLMRILDAARMG
jgi:GNAT superfamily N-acetyltransferase